MRIDQIIIGQRHRKAMGDIEGLARSMPPSGVLILSDSPFSAIAASHLFFKDGDMTPVAHLNMAGILFFGTDAGRAADAKRDALLASYHSEPQAGKEKQFERDIIADLRRRGIPFEQQKRCSWGIMDIFLPGDPPSIIELKEGSDRQSIGEAIGQLVFYGSEHPGARLYVGVPGGLDGKVHNILAERGIGEWQL